MHETHQRLTITPNHSSSCKSIHTNINTLAQRCTRQSYRQEPLSIHRSRLLPECRLRLLLFALFSKGSIAPQAGHAERRLISRPNQWRHRAFKAVTRSTSPWLLTRPQHRKATTMRARYRLQHLQWSRTTQHYPKHSSTCSIRLLPTTPLRRSTSEAAVWRSTSTCTRLYDPPSRLATRKSRD